MLTTKNIRLRAIEEEDLATLVKWKSDPGINQYFHEYRPLSLRNQKDWYEKQLNNSAELNLVAMTHDGSLIGTAGLVSIDARSRKAVLSRILIGEHSNRNLGMGSQIQLLMMQYAYDHLNLNKLYGEVLSSNMAALTFYKGFGFVEEGIFRNHVYKNGEYQDVVALACFKDDYIASLENGTIRKLFDRYI